MPAAKVTQSSGGPGPIPSSDAPHANTRYNQRDFDGYCVSEQPLYTKRPIRIICTGAGASGLQVAFKAKHGLENYELQIYEKNHDVGGTWLENRYPGRTCDVPSHSYQFPWARNPNWSAYYSSSAEIWQYFKDVAVKYDLEQYIKFNTKVTRAEWNESSDQWKVSLSGPDSDFEDWCDILYNTSGALNDWKYPNIPGLDTFKGKLMHSAAWDQEYDLNGKTVAVIGGGSSAVQIIPSIQPRVARLLAFVRSPVWITPGFGAKYAAPNGDNFEYSEEQKRRFRENPDEALQYTRGVENELNKRYDLMHINSDDQKISSQLVAKLMDHRLGDNKELSSHIIPSFPLGCRRMAPGAGYLESLSKENVQAITKSVVRLTQHGVVDESGNEYEVDCVICATGFDTSFSPHFEVIGRNRANLREQFGDFPVGYLGITVENFPNLFLISGPSAPSAHGSALPIGEWFTRCSFMMINKYQRDNMHSFEPSAAAIKDFYNHTHELMKRLVWSAPCRSWFKNGKTHGPVTAIWPGSRLHFFEVMKEVRWEDYSVRWRTENRFQFMGNGYTQVELSPDGDTTWYFDDDFVKLGLPDGDTMLRQ